MKKLLSVILAISILVACLNLGIAFVSASDTTSTNDISSINILTDTGATTFEDGTTVWSSYSAGTTTVVDNPNGEGKVLKYTHSGTNTWQSPCLNIRDYVKNALGTTPGKIYISFDIYSPKNMKAYMTIRTYTEGIFSACGSKNYGRLNGTINSSSEISVNAGQWKNVEFALNITQADLTSAATDPWMICLDQISDASGYFANGDVLYIDNVMACLSTNSVAEKTEIKRDNYTKVGAIRWDAFTKSGGTDPAGEVANALSPAEFHYQAPFFASITSDGKIEFPAYTLETWEKEAMYAHEAGLDYFSYLWYDTDSTMSRARKLHLQSKNKDMIQMAGILQNIQSTQTMSELFEAMKDSCWLRVSGRPVLFLYAVNDTNWTAEQVAYVRRMAYRSGIGESLYIIGMNTDYNDFDAKIYDRDMDAVSMYSYASIIQGEPYSYYTSRLESLTDAIVNATTSEEHDHQFVPIFSLGRDGRPRIKTSVSWIEGDPNAELDKDKPYGNKYTLEADMETVKSHIANIYKVTQEHADVTQPNLICAYGWNEHDEGGWLCPTLNCDANGNLNESNPINTERLDTLRETLDELREASYIAKPTADPNGTKTVYNGDAESGIDNWGNIHGGSFGYIQPGANRTNNAIRFIPSASKGVYESIAFNLAPAVINDGNYGYAGCGAGTYKVSFYIKAKSIPSGSNAKFSATMDVINSSLRPNDVNTYTGKSYNLDTCLYGSVNGSIITTSWTKFECNFAVTQDYLNMLKDLRNSSTYGNAKYAYNLALRIDCGSERAFGSVGYSFEYYIDEFNITYTTSSTQYPTPTPEPALPTASPSPTPIPADKVVQYLEYDKGENSVVITGSKMDIHGDIVIPDKIENLPVTKIGDGAFKYRAQLTSIKLPENLQTVGDFAFEKCINLKTVQMSNAIKEIGTHAFCGDSSLTDNIELTKAVTDIKPYTFYQCNSITNAKYLAAQRWFKLNVNVHEGNEGFVNVLSYEANGIEGATLNIGSSLNIDYYACFEANPNDVVMRFTKENRLVDTVQGEYDSGYGMYKFTYSGINPQCMTDTIKAELMLKDGTVLDTKENYSVKAYCDSMVSKNIEQLGVETINNELYLRAFRNLLADTLVYGAKAQEKQNYKTDRLADASDWVSRYKTTFVSPTGIRTVTGNSDSENLVKSVSLNMSNYNRIYFRLILTDESVKIKLNGVEVNREELNEQNDGTYILYTDYLKATEFDKVFTLQLIKDEAVISQVEYNVNAYIQSKNASSSVGEIVQALNNYGQSAIAYNNIINGAYDGDYDLDEEDEFSSQTVETWVVNEAVFLSNKTYNNPFEDVTMDLVLTNGHVTYTVPCFWDGGSVWRARFVCPSSGTWTYTTKCNVTGDTGLHNCTAKFVCKNYSGDLDIYKHGFVTTNGSKYFVYNDGTPFFYLGDTHWSMFSEFIDSPGKDAGSTGATSHFKYIVDKRVSQGFTVYQSEPINAPFNLMDGFQETDIQGFKKADRYFQYIAEKGLVHANAQFFFPDKMTQDIAENKAYLEQISRYWVARFGAYPVLWTLGQEIDNDFLYEGGKNPYWNYENNPWVKVAEYIHKYDAYQHPLTGHQENTGHTTVTGAGTGQNGIATSNGGKSIFLSDEVTAKTGHNWWGAQWSPVLNGQAYAIVAQDYWNSKKVAIMYESRYCYLGTKDFGARAQGWIAYLNGMYGYGYGAQDIWHYNVTYNENTESYDGVETITVADKQVKWSDAIEFESGYQVGYMRKFFSNIEWWKLTPKFFTDQIYFNPDKGVANNKGEYPDTSIYACATDANNTYVVYFYNQTTNTGTIGNMNASATYTAKWFNPRTNEYQMISQSIQANTRDANGNPGYTLPSKPDNNDWVVLVTKN